MLPLVQFLLWALLSFWVVSPPFLAFLSSSALRGSWLSEPISCLSESRTGDLETTVRTVQLVNNDSRPIVFGRSGAFISLEPLTTHLPVRIADWSDGPSSFLLLKQGESKWLNAEYASERLEMPRGGNPQLKLHLQGFDPNDHRTTELVSCMFPAFPSTARVFLLEAVNQDSRSLNFEKALTNFLTQRGVKVVTFYGLADFVVTWSLRSRRTGLQVDLTVSVRGGDTVLRKTYDTSPQKVGLPTDDWEKFVSARIGPDIEGLLVFGPR